MVKRTSSREYRVWYEKCRHRERIDLLAKQLRTLKYSETYIRNILREWLRLAKYCEDAGIDVPTSIYAQEAEDYIRRRLLKPNQYRRRTVIFAVRVFIEADDRGSFSRRVHAPAKLTAAIFNEWGAPYLRFLQEHRGLAEATLQLNGSVLQEFTNFVETRGVRDLNGLTADLVHDFCRSPGSRRSATWVSWMGVVRRFLRYAFMEGGLERDLSAAVGGAKRFRCAALPDALTESELNAVLSCMDRSSALGRRDSAILLLAARYGMRASDIRKLRLDDIHWRDDRIEFCQSKTGKPVALPLLPEVAEALVDYLRGGRPSTRSRNVFVRHRAPFEAFSPRHCLIEVMVKALRRAGLDRRPGPRGLHLLRRTLATRMLRANVPVKTIGDILGHTTTDSTFGYTRVDVAALRSAALSIAEVLL